MTNEVIASHFDRLRGRILGLIESWGLPPIQERGCKAIFKTLTYDMEKEIHEISSAMSDELEELRHRIRSLEK